jgi:hypothetical protein
MRRLISGSALRPEIGQKHSEIFQWKYIPAAKHMGLRKSQSKVMPAGQKLTGRRG